MEELANYLRILQAKNFLTDTIWQILSLIGNSKDPQKALQVTTPVIESKIPESEMTEAVRKMLMEKHLM